DVEAVRRHPRVVMVPGDDLHALRVGVPERLLGHVVGERTGRGGLGEIPGEHQQVALLRADPLEDPLGVPQARVAVLRVVGAERLPGFEVGVAEDDRGRHQRFSTVISTLTTFATAMSALARRMTRSMFFHGSPDPYSVSVRRACCWEPSASVA